MKKPLATIRETFSLILSEHFYRSHLLLFVSFLLFFFCVSINRMITELIEPWNI